MIIIYNYRIYNWMIIIWFPQGFSSLLFLGNGEAVLQQEDLQQAQQAQREAEKKLQD
jgi:hypothetical protein